MKDYKNVIFFTQASSLDLFYHVFLHLQDMMKLGKAGFYVADSEYFKKFNEKYKIENTKNAYFLKEWDIIKSSHHVDADYDVLRDYETRIGDPVLWNAIVGDRRIYFGRKYAFKQDYKSRFKHNEMMTILQVALQRIEKFFDEVQPDFIVSFVCVTIGDYLATLFAKERNIPILNLRPTKVKNFMFASESLLYPSEHLRKTYENYLTNSMDARISEQAERFINSVKESFSLYEGAILPSDRPPLFKTKKKRSNKLSVAIKIADLLRRELSLRFGESRFDNHLSGFIGPVVNSHFTRPLRARAVGFFLAKDYLKSDGLKNLRYAFFPLNVEPEFGLSVLNKANMNQIETIRGISHNLPVGMRLVVKEHPVAIGKRPVSYYRKLMQIPNVLIANPSTNSRDLILNSNIVVTVHEKSSIFLVAVILSRPVIILGGAPFHLFPNDMVINVRDLFLLGENIRKLLTNYNYNEKVLTAYIAALISESVDIDFFSILLGRDLAYRDKQDLREEDLEGEFKIQIKKLAEYLVQRYQIYHQARAEDVSYMGV